MSLGAKVLRALNIVGCLFFIGTAVYQIGGYLQAQITQCCSTGGSGGGGSTTDIISAATTYYVAPSALATCAYDGDGGQACTPSDSNACTAKATPCATIAGAQAKIANKIVNAVVTIQLADTSTSCYQPSDTRFSNHATGGNYSTALATGDGGVQDTVYPTGYIYIHGNTATPTNVNIVGAATCAGTTSSTLAGFNFMGTQARISGVQFKYFKFGLQANKSLIYLDNIYGISDNPAPTKIDASLAFVDNKSTLKIGGTVNITNWIAFTINGLSLLDSRSPAGYPTVTYSSSGGERFVLANEMSHMYLNGGTWSFTGTGAYHVFQAIEFSSINFNDGLDVATLTLNAANAIWLSANQGSNISEACGASGVSCTLTSFATRAEARHMSYVQYNGTNQGSTGDIKDTGACIANGTFPFDVDCSYHGVAIGAANIFSGYNLSMVGSSAKFQRDSAQLQLQFDVAGAQPFHSAVINAQRARGNIGATTAPIDGDDILSINAAGYDGSAYQSGANITLEAAGTWSGSNRASRITFSTVAAGSTTLTERFRIPDTGGIQIFTGSKPACSSATPRFTFFAVAGGAGVKDTVEVCAKDAGDAYAWRTIY